MATQIPLIKIERDPTYRLPESERRRLRRRFDLDALETLLAHVAPEHREKILECFRIPENDEVRELWQVGDPELQQMLEEVWAPMWDRVPLNVIESDETHRPGKRLAAARRRADPHPHEAVLAALEAMDAGRWDDVIGWFESGTVDTEKIDALRRARHGAAGSVSRSIVGGVAEGDETAHVLYREQRGGAREKSGQPGVVRVQTVRRTPEGWRLPVDDLLQQMGLTGGE